MPIEPGKTVMPIIDTKAVAIEPTNPVHWSVEERIAQRGVERTALQRESEIPTEWTEVLFTSQNFLKTFPPSSGWPGGPAVHLPGEVARPGKKSMSIILEYCDLLQVPVSSFETGPWAAKSGAMVDRQFIVVDRWL